MPFFLTPFLDKFNTPLVQPTQPESAPKPELVAWSESCAKLVDIKDIDVNLWAGNFNNISSYATRYGGHQFGHWAGQLGDGRALYLGERQGHEIQLKGAGLTEFSRRADGRAVLRSSLREFVCSEAMHALGVPTTRALALVKTGQPVMRDMFYDGNPEYETGAITTRVAPSFIRFGHFEMLASDSDKQTMLELADWCIDRYFPEVDAKDYTQWFHSIAKRTAKMVAHWSTIGFVHGVMNTDNMSILGLTIDYGPYGWLDVYDPDWTPNTTDFQNRRYRFGAQASVALWNLARLGDALAFMGVEIKSLEAGLEAFKNEFEFQNRSMWANKLGLSTLDGEGEILLKNLDQLWREHPTDMTIFMRLLSVGDSLELKKMACLSMPQFYRGMYRF